MTDPQPRADTDLSAQAEQRTIAPAAEPHDHEHAFDIPEALCIGAVALAAIAVWFHWWEPWPRFSVIGVAGLLIGGWPIFKEAIENLLARRMTMELSMTIAIVAAAAISEFFTALMITVLDRKSTRLNSSH